MEQLINLRSRIAALQDNWVEGPLALHVTTNMSTYVFNHLTCTSYYSLTHCILLLLCSDQVNIDWILSSSQIHEIHVQNAVEVDVSQSNPIYGRLILGVPIWGVSGI